MAALMSVNGGCICAHVCEITL